MRKLRFGIELEVATKLPRQKIVEALNDAGIKTKSSSYGSSTVEGEWKVQPDGSVNGWEIVSPPLEDTRELEIVTNVLRKELKVRCTKKTGLHIHHDVNDLTLDQLKNAVRLFHKYESTAIHSITSPNRHDNQYCRPLCLSDMRDIEKAETPVQFGQALYTRYKTLNVKSYIEHGTLEFRGAQGTVEIDRILAWIELTHKIIETATQKTEIKKLNSGRTNEEALLIMFNELELSYQTQKHYSKVQKFFSKLA